jgi:hypothetical protein
MSGGYYVFPDPESFFEWSDQCDPHFHEVCLEGRQKMRFDMDVPYMFPNKIKNSKKILEDLLLAVEKAFERYLKPMVEREFSFEELVVLENHRKGKYSWHVVMKDTWMVDSASCLYFAKKVKEMMRSRESAEYLDLQVYKKMQCFRMEGNGKRPKEGEEQTVLEVRDFEVEGVKYDHRYEKKDSLISWYEDGDDDSRDCSFRWNVAVEREGKSVRGLKVVNMVGGGYNVSEGVLRRVLGMVDPNDFEGKGGEWRAFSRCVYNIFGRGGEIKKSEVKREWMEWCEGYYRNNEAENEGLWKSFGKSKVRYGIPKLKGMLGKYKRMSVSEEEVLEVVCELSMDKGEGYPLVGSVVKVRMGGKKAVMGLGGEEGHEMEYKLDEKGVKKLIRLNENRGLSWYYVSGMKAAVGGGYLLESMLGERYELSEREKEMIHKTKPSVKNFYGILLATIKANKGSFDRVKSSVEEVWEEYKGLRDYFARDEGGGEEKMEEGKVKRVEGMEFVDDEAMKPEVVYVRSPTGSGKTQAMVKWLGEEEEGEYKNKRCCIVTQRVSLSEDLYNHFEKLGFQHYKRVEDVRKVDRLIIQVESLWKLVGSGREPLELFDVLLLDESESLVSQFLSKNIKRVNETRAVVEWLLKYSKKVVCMDAYLSADTVDMVRAFRGKSVDEVFYVNKTKTEVGTRVEVVHYYEELMKQILISAYMKRKICIATNSIQKSREFYKMLTGSEMKNLGLKVALYNSDHLKKFWGDLSDVNSRWKKYDVIIYTSSIETGISFTEEHFDELFGYFTPQSTNYKSALQMLKRVRNLNHKRMVLYVKPMKLVSESSFGEEQYDQLWEDTVGDYLSDIPFQMDRRGMKIQKYKGSFYDLAMINYRREVESRSNYFYLMMHHLEKLVVKST